MGRSAKRILIAFPLKDSPFKVSYLAEGYARRAGESSAKHLLGLDPEGPPAYDSAGRTNEKRKGNYEDAVEDRPLESRARRLIFHPDLLCLEDFSR